MIDFEDQAYDALDVQAHDADADVLSHILSVADVRINRSDEARQGTVNAVATALESCLRAVDTLFLERDAVSITHVSIENGSWEEEKAPVPCDMDSWVRAAIPENVEKPARSQPNSGIMAQFLRDQARGGGKSRAGSAVGQRTPMAERSQALVSPSNEARPMPNVPQRAVLSAERRKGEDRMREELRVRREQASH